MALTRYVSRSRSRTGGVAHGGRAGLCLCLCLGVAAAGCGTPRRAAPPADEPQAAVPNLAGLRVMVLPSQPARGGVPEGLDAAIGANLEDRAPAVDWVMPAELERALARAPMFEIRLNALPVSILRKPELVHVSEPLYGQLRRLGALVDARYAVLPFAAGYLAGTAEEPGRIEVAAVIVDTVGGRLLWRGIVAGERGPAGDEVVLATAAQAVAEMIAPSE